MKVSYYLAKLFQPCSLYFFLLFGPREVLGTKVDIFLKVSISCVFSAFSKILQPFEETEP